MQFLYETEAGDYRDFASGRVLRNAPGTTAFPVRLTSEILFRCRALIGKKTELTIYDPCCGGAHMLTAAGFLHGRSITTIVGSDVNSSVVPIAESNVSLLTREGLKDRKQQLQAFFDEFQKSAHREALESIERLEQLQQKAGPFHSLQAFDHDITTSPPSVEGVNIIIADLPYGNTVDWQTTEDEPLHQMLQNVYETLDPDQSVVALISDKKQQTEHQYFERVKALKHGKRKITLLKPR
ncbi:rRNA methyltransferase AviRa [Geomicrobium sp. JCM 19037]|uniref:hypothetical protein n=1 Tax=Geomicrobium sp. JCM 19037 TaxID=1460634 RepID=UPI00045F24F8|nr:hypothetical protein [Geomicrobium sp. JCM 19037]GAK05572.1 rRNA methyltransferase AviRa [Geomicrobium sp. JCM 19037]